MRCKKGDLAIVVKSPNKFTIGWIVEIKEYLGDSYGGYRYVWEIEAKNHQPKIGRWIGSDDWLLPIHPGDLHEIAETKKVLEFALHDRQAN